MRSFALSFLALAALAAAPAPAQPPNGTGGPPDGADSAPEPTPAALPESEFLRLAVDAEGAVTALQTSILSFRSRDAADDAPVVDLVSAVHIGDADYYAALNERFGGYDAVLYELVAPEGTRVARGGSEARGDSPVSAAQLAMTRILDLTFQLDEIDYTSERLVHADLSPDEMQARMTERGESVLDYFWKIFTVSMGESAQDPYGLRSVGLLAALLSNEPQRLLKLQLAATMLQMDAVTEAIEGADGSTLIGDRNARAIEKLEERIGLGDRRIAIFYGAAHMTDMAARLEAALGLVPGDPVWLDAWDRTGGAPAAPSAEPPPP